MGYLKRRRASDAAIDKSAELLKRAEAEEVTPDRREALIKLSDAWLRHAATAAPAPR